MEDVIGAYDVLGEFELDLVTSRYEADQNTNAITIITDWRGSTPHFELAFVTLKYFSIPLIRDEDILGGDFEFAGQGFLADGTSRAGIGKGTWKKDPEKGNIWNSQSIINYSDGRTIRSLGRVDLANGRLTGIHTKAST